jgi:tetrahydromethanopterin S-methyltransferase subunit A
VIDGDTAAEVYTPAIERGLLSRLDHAVYLGRELARAERALMTDEPYIQDSAPEGASSPLTAPLPKTQTSCCGTSTGSHETCSSNK